MVCPLVEFVALRLCWFRVNYFFHDGSNVPPFDCCSFLDEACPRSVGQHPTSFSVNCPSWNLLWKILNRQFCLPYWYLGFYSINVMKTWLSRLRPDLLLTNIYFRCFLLIIANYILVLLRTNLQHYFILHRIIYYLFKPRARPRLWNIVKSHISWLSMMPIMQPEKMTSKVTGRKIMGRSIPRMRNGATSRIDWTSPRKSPCWHFRRLCEVVFLCPWPVWHIS